MCSKGKSIAEGAEGAEGSGEPSEPSVQSVPMPGEEEEDLIDSAWRARTPGAVAARRAEPGRGKGRARWRALACSMPFL